MATDRPANFSPRVMAGSAQGVVGDGVVVQTASGAGEQVRRWLGCSVVRWLGRPTFGGVRPRPATQASQRPNHPTTEQPNHPTTSRNSLDAAACFRFHTP